MTWLFRYGTIMVLLHFPSTPHVELGAVSMSSHLLTPGLQLFYDLVHSLNSTLELDRVLEQVIDQVNDFLHIDATSVSLLDPESQELVIMMTVGQATDPKPGLRLPPHAGVAGWVARHGEPVLIPDAQQDERFFPGVDQLTGFTTRSMLCVPLRIQDRCVGVIQAISGICNAFSHADMVYVITLADVAALAIENARLYTAELALRQQAERFQSISNVLGASLDREDAVQDALEILSQIVPCDRAVVYLCQASTRFVPVSQESIEAVLESVDYLEVSAVQGFDDPDAAREYRVLASEVSMLQQMSASQRPISVADIAQDDRYIRLPGAPLDRSWLGAPMIVDRGTIGLVALSRDQVHRFTDQEMAAVEAFARQVAGALTRNYLYRETRDRADEFGIVDNVTRAVVSATELQDLLQQIAGSLLTLMHIDGVGIVLCDFENDRSIVQLQVGLSSGLAEMLACHDAPACEMGQKALSSGRTVLVMLGAGGDPLPGVGAIVPLLVSETPVGLLVLERRESGQLLSRHMALLEIVGRQIATAVDRARLHQAARGLQ